MVPVAEFFSDARVSFSDEFSLQRERPAEDSLVVSDETSLAPDRRCADLLMPSPAGGLALAKHEELQFSVGGTGSDTMMNPNSPSWSTNTVEKMSSTELVKMSSRLRQETRDLLKFGKKVGAAPTGIC